MSSIHPYSLKVPLLRFLEEKKGAQSKPLSNYMPWKLFQKMFFCNLWSILDQNHILKKKNPHILLKIPEIAAIFEILNFNAVVKWFDLPKIDQPKDRLCHLHTPLKLFFRTPIILKINPENNNPKTGLLVGTGYDFKCL